MAKAPASRRHVRRTAGTETVLDVLLRGLGRRSKKSDSERIRDGEELSMLIYVRNEGGRWSGDHLLLGSDRISRQEILGIFGDEVETQRIQISYPESFFLDERFVQISFAKGGARSLHPSSRPEHILVRSFSFP